MSKIRPDDKLVDALDRLLPKSRCEERGETISLLAYYLRGHESQVSDLILRGKIDLINELLVDVSSDSANIDQAEMISLLNVYSERIESQLSRPEGV